MDKEYKNFDFPVMKVLFIVFSFALAILDMIFLYRALAHILGDKESEHSVLYMGVAFLLATAANFIAFTWGQKNGENMAEKAINKHSIGFFAAWVAIGLGYTAIRIIDLIMSIKSGDGSDTYGNLITMGLLIVSYVGTGTLIQASAREICDAELSALRKAKKKFERANEDLADGYADIKESIGVLKSYDINYKTLDVQYRKCLTSMIRTENATMSVIVGRMLAKHGEVNPKLANDILKEVIEERNGKWLEQEVSRSVKGL